MCNSNRNPQSGLNRTKNRTPSTCLATTPYVYAQLRSMYYFLVQFNNSDWFQTYRVTRSYSSHPFLCTLKLIPYLRQSLLLLPLRSSWKEENESQLILIIMTQTFYHTGCPWQFENHFMWQNTWQLSRIFLVPTKSQDSETFVFLITSRLGTMESVKKSRTANQHKILRKTKLY